MQKTLFEYLKEDPAVRDFSFGNFNQCSAHSWIYSLLIMVNMIPNPDPDGSDDNPLKLDYYQQKTVRRVVGAVHKAVVDWNSTDTVVVYDKDLMPKYYRQDQLLAVYRKKDEGNK